MPDLIDREAAVTAVDMDTSMVLPANSKPGSVAWRMRDAALNALRALPAIGTCKDCAEWNRGVQGYGECTSSAYARAGVWRPMFTEPDHSCAAWRAKP